jgi:preprotein translocase subunit SecG
MPEGLFLRRSLDPSMAGHHVRCQARSTPSPLPELEVIWKRWKPSSLSSTCWWLWRLSPSCCCSARKAERLGIGGGGGGNFMSSRGQANVLTRATAFLALGFFITSISLTVLAQTGAGPSSILDRIPDAQPTEDGTTLAGTDWRRVPVEAPAVDEPGEPQIPTTQ